jgi:hypothetical protein
VKRQLRRLLDATGGRVSGWQVRRFRRRHAGPITVLDIDNTLADAWPTLQRAWPSDRARQRAMELLPGMKAAAYDRATGPVLFLSHRNWWDWNLTRRWLAEHGMHGTLVLVASAQDKIAHLEVLAAGGGPVTYWDDLSHGTEHGETRFYHEVIDAARRLGIDHHGRDEIEAIVAAAGGRRPLPR